MYQWLKMLPTCFALLNGVPPDIITSGVDGFDDGALTGAWFEPKPTGKLEAFE